MGRRGNAALPCIDLVGQSCRFAFLANCVTVTALLAMLDE